MSLRLSPSALQRYLDCPKRFRLQDLAGERPELQASPVLARANAIHHALERFFGLPLEHRQPEHLERALRAVWTQHRRGAFHSLEQEADYGRGALEMLHAFAESFDLSAQPLAREQWLSTRLGNGVEVFGKVDRVDALDGGLEIIDYKTGNRPLEARDLRHEPATQVYAAAARDSFGLAVRRMRLIYLAGPHDVAWEIEPEEEAALRERLVKITSEIAAATVFEASPGPHCNWCPFALRCVERTAVTLEELVPVEGLPFDLPLSSEGTRAAGAGLAATGAATHVNGDADAS